MNSGNGCFNSAIFNDSEVVNRQNKKSNSLDCCFSLPECLPRSVGDLTADYPDDELLTTALGQNQTTTPSKVVLLSQLENSSPRSVIFPSVYDGPTKQHMGVISFNSNATAANWMESDPDLLYYESSDSDEEPLNDSDHSNHDADTADDTNPARPKGILRNKEENALDRYLKSKAKVDARNRSEGSVGYSVQFAHHEDDAEEESFTSVFDQRENYYVMQTPGQLQLVAKVYHKKIDRYTKKRKNRKNNGLQRPELAVTSLSPESTSSQSSESRHHVRQLLSKLARQVLPRQSTDVDGAGVVEDEEDIVEESLTIECELQDDDDDTFHVVHILTAM